MRLTWEAERGQVGVSISDDGCGIQAEAAQQPQAAANRGVGLMIMRERVAALGGRVSVDSGIGRGTTLRIVLPIENCTGTPSHA